MNDGRNPFAWLFAIFVGTFAFAVVIVAVLWAAPGAVRAMLEMGSVGTLLLGGTAVGLYTALILSIDGFSDGFAALMATAGVSLREKKGRAAKTEADADATRAQAWTPGASNGKVADGEYTGEWP